MDFRYLYTSFDGRINRKPFWMASIALGIVLMILNFIIVMPLVSTNQMLGSLFSLILTLAFMYPLVALGVKRLHDRGKSGRLMAVFIAPGLISQVGSLLGITVSANEIGGETVMLPNVLGSILGLITLVVGIWALVELGIRQGTRGDNAFGPDPLGNAVTQTADSAR